MLFRSQVPILLCGFYYGVRALHKVGSGIFSDARQLQRSQLPPTVLLIGVTVVFLKLFVG